jgi:hypothetical protein
MCVIGGACNGYGSWHDVEHGKRSCTCCVKDTCPPSTEGLEMISDCTTDLHLQRVLLSDSPYPGPGSALATGLLHALLDLSGWARWSVVKVLNQVFLRRGTQWTRLCFRPGGVDHVDVIDCSLGPLCRSLAGDCGLCFIQLGSVVVIPWGICNCGKQVSLLVVQAMAQDAPVRLHFVEVLISKLL